MSFIFKLKHRFHQRRFLHVQITRKRNKVLNINEESQKIIWKYDLKNEAIAAAVAGMFPITNLDQRCITFTIHLHNRTQHEALCRILFDTIEVFMKNLDLKQKSASYSGLASFIDVNGSKFGGFDRDPSQIHCHGCIFIPYGIDSEQIISLINNLTTSLWGRSDLVKTTQNAVHFAVFDRNRSDATILDWISYAQKEECRVESEESFGFYLPFDIRHTYGEKVAAQMEAKRAFVLGMLQGRQNFKIFRKPCIASHFLARFNTQFSWE
jgi:hypothetical protein